MNKVKRPISVWVISIFYTLSFGFSLISVLLTLTGIIPINQAQQNYYASLGVVDYITTIIITILGLSATITLFMLRRIAVTLFGMMLCIDIVLTVIQIFGTNYLAAIGGPGFVGTIISYIILFFIFIYSKNLAKKHILT